MSVRFLVSGDTALVVEFGDRVEREMSDRVLRLSRLVRASATAGVVETVPTYRSLMVQYDPLITDHASLIAAIEKLIDSSAAAEQQAKLWRIPACYAESHAPDLAQVAERVGLSPEEVVRLHTEARLHVYMVGFVPGFPYMGDLPEPLVLPRRTDPRIKVPAGSIATAQGMTGIYPVESPGGWHLIGATPIRLFDARLERPALLSPGDKVRFDPVSSSEFETIASAVAAGTYEVLFDTMAA